MVRFPLRAPVAGELTDAERRDHGLLARMYLVSWWRYSIVSEQALFEIGELERAPFGTFRLVGGG